MAATPPSPQEKGPDGEPAHKNPSKPTGWVDDLARRSTGLPSDRPEPRPSAPGIGDSGLWKLAGMGIQFAGTVVVLAFIGSAIDRKMGWSPWALISCSMVAVIGNLYLLIKESLKEDKPGKPRAK